MAEIGQILDEILEEYKAMSTEELDTFLNETISTLFGQFIQKVNNETMEAMSQIAVEDSCDIDPESP